MNCIDYFNQVYQSDRDLCRTSVFDYRNALRRLEQSEGRPIDIDEIDEPMIARLAQFMESIGLSKRTVNNRANMARMVARHWKPERFPWTRTKPTGRWPEPLPAVDVKPKPAKRKRMLAGVVGWLNEKFGD